MKQCRVLGPKPCILHPTPSFWGERGLALIVVLWILTFLGVVFTTFTFSMRTELAAAGNFRQEAEAYYLAEAGVYRAAAEIINADRNVAPDSTLYDASTERWHANPAAYQNVALGGGHYWVTVTDEESKIPLNPPAALVPQYDAILRRLFSNAGVTDEKLVSTIVDSIQDWRDIDNLHRVNGAEDDYYLSRSTPYRQKNGDFTAIDELLLVKGMTPEILYGNITNTQRRAELQAQLPWERDIRPGEYLGVARHLSIFSSGKVNVNTTGPEVMMALGLTAAETKSVLERRAAVPFKTPREFMDNLTSIFVGGRQGFQVIPGGQPGVASLEQIRALFDQIADVRSRHFVVRSAGRMAGSRLTVPIVAILRNDGGAGRPKLSVQLWSLDPRQAGT